MGREIKFRIWKPNYKLFDYAKLEEYLSSKGILDQKLGYNDIGNIWNQFTGLLDKNGKEIYEGDIIAGYTTWGFIVCFEKGHTVIKWTDYDSSKLSENLEQEYINEEECIIVGNIHDNKGLL